MKYNYITDKFMDNNLANMLTGSATGDAIRVDDVSPVEHKVGVKLTSETITDFSEVTVTRYGKNLVNPDTLYINGEGEVTTSDNIITITYGRKTTELYIPLGRYNDFVGKEFIISGSQTNNYDNNPISVYMHTEKGNLGWLTDFYAYSRAKVFTIPENTKGYENISIRILALSGLKTEGDTVVIKNLQIEVGNTGTSWEAYKESVTYPVNTDGVVEGVTSLAPTMSLLANNQNAVIEATYNKDVNKVIEKLTNAIISLGGEV